MELKRLRLLLRSASWQELAFISDREHCSIPAIVESYIKEGLIVERRLLKLSSGVMYNAQPRDHEDDVAPIENRGVVE